MATRLTNVPDRDREFVDRIPELYDRHLGPMFFEPYAREIVRRLVLPTTRGAALLEIAAGTGIVTEALCRALPPTVSFVATDLNAPMLAVARTRIDAAGLSSRVIWREADATSLPFGDASFDAVVCQFGFMFFPDKPKAAREALRVLRPGGQWLFNVWGSLDEDPIAAITHRVLASFFKDDPPEFYTTPFGFSDAAMLRAIATDAGFADVSVEDVPLIAESSTARSAAIGLVEGNPVSIRERGVDPAAVVDALAAELARHHGDAPLRAPMLARFVSARKG